MLVDLIIKASLVETQSSLYTGIRKIVRGLSFNLESLPDVDMEVIGYKGNGHKVKQLLRNYHNGPEIESARTKLKTRRSSEHTSVAVSTLGQAKDSRSQGFCLRNIIITQTPKITEVDIIWRSTELIQRNTADYALIPLILEQLELAHEPSVYRLYFCNAYLTALRLPIFFRFMDPIIYFELLKRHDPKYFRIALNAFAKFTESTCRYNYKHRQIMYEYAHKYLNISLLKQYCIDNNASFKSEDEDENI